MRYELEDGDIQIGDRPYPLYSLPHLRHGNIYNKLSPVQLACSKGMQGLLNGPTFRRMINWTEKYPYDRDMVYGLLVAARSIGLSEGPYGYGGADALTQAAILIMECHGVSHPKELPITKPDLSRDEVFAVLSGDITDDEKGALVTHAFFLVADTLAVQEETLERLLGCSAMELEALRGGERAFSVGSEAYQKALTLIRLHHCLHMSSDGDRDSIQESLATPVSAVGASGRDALENLELLDPYLDFMERRTFASGPFPPHW